MGNIRKRIGHAEMEQRLFLSRLLLCFAAKCCSLKKPIGHMCHLSRVTSCLPLMPRAGISHPNLLAAPSATGTLRTWFLPGLWQLLKGKTDVLKELVELLSKLFSNGCRGYLLFLGAGPALATGTWATAGIYLKLAAWQFNRNT